METNVNYTIVGAFVILLVTAIVLAIIWLSVGFSFENYRTFKIYMQESVSGLTIDSPVEFNGVTVGKVTKIKIDNNNPNVVVILTSLKRSTPVTRGTVAMLSTRGITGFVFITLVDKGSNHSPVIIQPGEHYPIIPTEPSIFVRLDSALTQISNSFTHLDDAFTNLLSPDNIESLKEVLYSVKQFTNTLSANSENISAIMQNTRKASSQFGPFLQSGQNAMRSFESQTLPAANQALSNIENASQALGDFANQLKQNPAMLIRGRASGTLGPGETP